MRRTAVFLVGLTALVLLLAPWATAAPAARSVPVTPPAPLPAGGVPVVLEPATPADIQTQAADACLAAAELEFQYDQVLKVGGVTDVSGFGREPGDPNLSACFFEQPSNPAGYRSAWYKFTAPVGGTLVVKTGSNADYRRNYDTTVAIFEDLGVTPDTCTDLALRGCNDDAHGILSEATARIEGGRTYYVEVVDRVLATTGQVQLNVEATILPDPTWNTTTTLMPEPLSRHAVVISGTRAFILGGETRAGTAPIRTGNTWRYETTTNEWFLLADLKIGQTSNGEGYANTDAVRMGNEIHYVSGSIGSPTEYEGQHWIYSIPGNSWSRGLDVNWAASPAGKPVGYSELVEYQSGSQTGFYLVGGLTGRFLAADPSMVGASDIFYRYVDTGASKVWQALPPMTRARYAQTAAAINNLVCVVGGLTTGLNGSGQLENQLIFDGECYNTLTGSWQPNVGSLNHPRYMAGSAVGPDGRWYVFGGVDQFGNYVPFVEVHDFVTATWEVLPANFNVDQPPLAWTRGGFVGDTLWLFGGEQQGNPTAVPVPLVQYKKFPRVSSFTGTKFTYFPFLQLGGAAAGKTPATAERLTVGLPAQGSFEGIGDVYDVFSFAWPGGQFTGTLTNIPFGSDYDLILLDSRKNFMAASQLIGSSPELMFGPLNPGFYYLLVARSSPPPSSPPDTRPYTIEVR